MPDVDNPGSIQEQLRNLANHINNQFGHHPHADICRQAADHIDSLENPVEEESEEASEEEEVEEPKPTTRKRGAAK